MSHNLLHDAQQIKYLYMRTHNLSGTSESVYNIGDLIYGNLLIYQQMKVNYPFGISGLTDILICISLMRI